MRTVLALQVAALFGFGVACGGEDGEGEPDLTGAAGYVQQKRLVSQVSCTCQDGGGALVPENDRCVQDDLGMQTGCEERVLDQRWDELRVGGECLEESYRIMKECLLEACELERCYGVLRAETAKCPQNVKDAFRVCQ